MARMARGVTDEWNNVQVIKIEPSLLVRSTLCHGGLVNISGNLDLMQLVLQEPWYTEIWIDGMTLIRLQLQTQGLIIDMTYKLQRLCTQNFLHYPL